MKVPVIKPVGSTNMWVVIERWSEKHTDVIIDISPGFCTDLASVPKWARSIIQKTDRRFWGPAIAHDYRYIYEIGDKRISDLNFYLGLRKNEVHIVKAIIAYIAVIYGGKGAW